MNILKVYNESIVKEVNDGALEILFTQKEGEAVHLTVTALKDTHLFLAYIFDQKTKLEVEFIVKPYVHVILQIEKEGFKNKINTTYTLHENSTLEIEQFNHTKGIKEKNIFYLKERASKVQYIVKGIASEEENYRTVVYHEAEETMSYLYSDIVSIQNGSANVEMINQIGNKIKNCTVHQEGRIITHNHNVCKINPILLIDNNDSYAFHSAHIGKMPAEILFYLQSRGLPVKEAEKLYVQGFLEEKLTHFSKDQILSIIKTYWR